MGKLEQLQASLSQHIAGTKNSRIAHNQLIITVETNQWLNIAKQLRDDYEFSILIDICGVDYSTYGKTNWQTTESSHTGFGRSVFDDLQDIETVEHKFTDNRYCVVYQLLDINNNRRLTIKIFPENNDYPMLSSVESIWKTANWFEREAFDLFGILFENHSDLRRILTDYGFVGHPLRKDFPLTGHVEMIYDEQKKQVVYQPVTIKNRINTPRVIRKQ